MEPRDIFDERARETIRFGVESVSVEFKESQPFDSLRHSIAKAALAMANNRDGGMIVVGVSQRDPGAAVADGVSTEVEHTYDHDAIYEWVNRYASPAIELHVLAVEHDAKRFIAIAIPPFGRSPTVCKKQTPDGLKDNEKMMPGDVIMRTTDRIGSSRVTSAAMMENLLQLAATRRAVEMIAMLRAGGVEPGDLAARAEQNLDDAEVSDIAQYL